MDGAAVDAGAVDARASPDGSCTTDADGDGHRSTACGGDDCNDADPNAYPGNPEVCDAAGHDEDCNAMTLGPDADGDGFPGAGCCNVQPSGSLLCGGDCDDTRATVNPSAVESCNGVDDNCNGTIDEGLLRTTFYPDCDGDGYGDASATPMMACAAPPTAPASCPGGIWATTGTDCRDDSGSVHPGAAPPCSCGAGHTYDADGDGAITMLCGGDDCDDHDARAHPGGTEVCDGADNDCDGRIDWPTTGVCIPCETTGCTTGQACCRYYPSDGMSMCVPASTTSCSTPTGHMLAFYDCDGPEDCATGETCCGPLGSGHGFCTTSTCSPTAMGWPVCHDDTDCAAGYYCPTTSGHSCLIRPGTDAGVPDLGVDLGPMIMMGGDAGPPGDSGVTADSGAADAS